MFDDAELKAFLADDWRQRCKVFRQVISPDETPLSLEGICELTTDDRVESRLISPDYEVIHGPFEMDTSVASLLPAQHMLMVQCLEQLEQSVAAMLKTSFGFIPAWQVDDVMASAGETGASCGAHFDHYDVFLVQHTGSKIWHLDEGGHLEEDLRTDCDVRLLKEFNATETVTLEPGDVLYVPPGFGHHGICDGTSITLSVGIRNPTHAELLDDIATHAIVNFGSNAPLDPDLHVGGTALPHDLIDEFTGSLHAMMNSTVLMRWYGCFVTQLREPALLPEPVEFDERQKQFTVTLPSRLAWTQDEHSVLLFANGGVIQLPPAARDWVPDFCRERKLSTDALSDDESRHCLELLVELSVIS